MKKTAPPIVRRVVITRFVFYAPSFYYILFYFFSRISKTMYESRSLIDVREPRS